MKKTKAVIGLGFGDECKGTTVSYLSSLEDSIIFKYTGGQQEGHTICSKDTKHICSQFGSGVLNNTPAIILSSCTFDPIAAWQEYIVLKRKGLSPTVYIHPDTPITTPYEIDSNRNDMSNISHGSCGSGVNKTLRRQEDYYSLTFYEFFANKFIFENKLQQIRNYYKYPFEEFPPHTDTFLKAREQILDNPDVFKLLGTTPMSIEEGSKVRDNFIYEGSQGLLLDPEIGIFPHVTPTRTGQAGIPNIIDEIYYVTRAYQTRHGNGPMSNTFSETNKSILPENIPEEINVTNPYQGEFRKGLLDLDLLKYAMYQDKAPLIKYDLTKHQTYNLVITCVDQLQNYKLIDNGVTLYFATEGTFLNHIQESFKGLVTNFYVSRSPIGTKIEKL